MLGASRVCIKSNLLLALTQTRRAKARRRGVISRTAGTPRYPACGLGWDVRRSACASVTQTSGVANALLPRGLFQHATPPAAWGLLSASPGTPIPAQEIQSRQIEIGSRLHLTRLCQALCSTAGPPLLSSPHLLYRRGAQLRASDRTRHTPRSRPSAATPRARQRRLHALPHVFSACVRSSMSERPALRRAQSRTLVQVE